MGGFMLDLGPAFKACIDLMQLFRAWAGCARDLLGGRAAGTAKGSRVMNIPSLCQSAFGPRADVDGLEFKGRRRTFGEIESEARHLAVRLRADGLVPGDRVAVYMKNSPELIVAYLAAVGSGFIFTPINVLYQRGEIEHILRDAEPAVLFADREAEAVLAPVLARLPSVRLHWAEDLAEVAAARLPEVTQGEQPQKRSYRRHRGRTRLHFRHDG